MHLCSSLNILWWRIICVPIISENLCEFLAFLSQLNRTLLQIKFGNTIIWAWKTPHIYNTQKYRLEQRPPCHISKFQLWIRYNNTEPTSCKRDWIQIRFLADGGKKKKSRSPVQMAKLYLLIFIKKTLKICVCPDKSSSNKQPRGSIIWSLTKRIWIVT